MLGVFFSLVSAVLVFLRATIDIINLIGKCIKDHTIDTPYLVASVIGSIDLYLIGVVLLIFSFGIYELFISKLDIAKKNTDINILETPNLDALKNRIIKVVIMVLVVSFFKKLLEVVPGFETSLDMLWFALSIFLVSAGVYFMHKGH
mgnify:FL=1